MGQIEDNTTAKNNVRRAIFHPQPPSPQFCLSCASSCLSPHPPSPCSSQGFPPRKPTPPPSEITRLPIINLSPADTGGRIWKHQPCPAGIIQISWKRRWPIVSQPEQFPRWLWKQLVSSLLPAMDSKWRGTLYLTARPGCRGIDRCSQHLQMQAQAGLWWLQRITLEINHQNRTANNHSETVPNRGDHSATVTTLMQTESCASKWRPKNSQPRLLVTSHDTS